MDRANQTMIYDHCRLRRQIRRRRVCSPAIRFTRALFFFFTELSFWATGAHGNLLFSQRSIAPPCAPRTPPARHSARPTLSHAPRSMEIWRSLTIFIILKLRLRSRAARVPRNNAISVQLDYFQFSIRQFSRYEPKSIPILECGSVVYFNPVKEQICTLITLDYESGGEKSTCYLEV